MKLYTFPAKFQESEKLSGTAVPKKSEKPRKNLRADRKGKRRLTPPRGGARNAKRAAANAGGERAGSAGTPTGAARTTAAGTSARISISSRSEAPRGAARSNRENKAPGARGNRNGSGRLTRAGKARRPGEIRPGAVFAPSRFSPAGRREKTPATRPDGREKTAARRAVEKEQSEKAPPRRGNSPRNRQSAAFAEKRQRKRFPSPRHLRRKSRRRLGRGSGGVFAPSSFFRVMRR